MLRPIRKLAAGLFVSAFVFSATSAGQKLPDKIRGYKVENAGLRISQMSPDISPRPKDVDLFVSVGKPRITLGLLSSTIEIGGEFLSAKESGEVDMLTFHDVRVNGVAVEVEEYAHRFSFKKGERVTIPEPARARLGATSMAAAAYRELANSRDDWRVTGTAFVFGRFKKFGLSFKRVIPVKFDLKIENPLSSASK